MSNRRIGPIQAIKSSTVPKEIIIFDTETHINYTTELSIEFPLRLGVLIYIKLNKKLHTLKREVYTYYNSEDAIAYITSKLRKNKTITLFAHNIGFDIRVLNLPELFTILNWEHKPPIINGRAFIWRVKNTIGRLSFIDTSNFAVHSVAQLGHDLKFPKMIVDFDNCTDEELIEYCRNDCEILERFVLDYVRFIHNNDLGKFQATLASQALTAYRKRFMNIQPYIHNHELTTKLERDSYHGGRVEVFKMGHYRDNDYYTLDINSMYPYIMYNYELPYQLNNYTEFMSYSQLLNRIRDNYVIAEVIIQTDKPYYPILFNGKLVFPIGEFKTALHHEELKLAIENKHIKRILRVATYLKATLFKDYVEFFYTERQKAKQSNNYSWDFICKIFLNSLYGKFGQINPLRLVVGEVDEKLVSRIQIYRQRTKEFYTEILWQGKVYRETKQGESTYSFPAIAGAITASARTLLYKYALIAGLDNTYYADTDSLIVNNIGYNNLSQYIDPNQLGMLKVEGSSNSVTIYGNKDYEFGGKVRHKGIKLSSIQTEPNRWAQLQFSSFISWMNNGDNVVPSAKWISKRRLHIYGKGNAPRQGEVTPYLMTCSLDPLTKEYLNRLTE